MNLKEYNKLLRTIKFEGITPTEGMCSIITKRGFFGSKCIDCEQFYIEPKHLYKK